MKRKLFYLFERLQIKKSERVAIIILLTLSVILTGVNSLSDLLHPEHEYDYSRADSLFAVKSAQIEHEHNQIMERYQPLPESDRRISESQGVEPAVHDTVPPDSTDQGTIPDADALININTATAEELQELPGIGPAYASRIVEWREDNGRFTSKEQLIEIKGIGEKRLEAIKPLITL